VSLLVGADAHIGTQYISAQRTFRADEGIRPYEKIVGIRTSAFKTEKSPSFSDRLVSGNYK